MERTPYRAAAWPQLRAYVLMRDNHECRIAGPGCTHVATQADHIIPWRAGGSWLDPTNLRAACAYCNTTRPHRKTPPPPTPTPSRTW